MMQTWITEIMEQFGYVGIFFIMLLENVFPPIPSELVLPFGGFLTTYSNLSIVGVVITATTGSLLGAIILYGIGQLLDVERLEAFIAKWGHVLHVKKADIRKADQWFHKYGYWTILFCRLIPLVRSLISIPAGMARMHFTLFLLFTLIGTLCWNIVLVLVGAMLGSNWQTVLLFMEMYANVVYIFIGISVLLLIILLIFRKRKNGK